MGLNGDSIVLSTAAPGFVIRKAHDTDKVVALGGNPNVGKSTVFNELTGLRQHTGNWHGKTVTNAQGYCRHKQNGYVLVDLPGCYSLMSHSAEEEAARDFIFFGGADAVIIVCDATCLERGLNLVLQTIEITPNVVLCVNLMDEAKRKRIKIDLHILSAKLGVPVVGTAARSKKGLDKLMDSVAQIVENPRQSSVRIQYPHYIETALSTLEPYVNEICGGITSSRWLSLILLQQNQNVYGLISRNILGDFQRNSSIIQALEEISESLERQGITERQVKDDIVSSVVQTAENICHDAVTNENKSDNNYHSRIDNILTGKWTAFPIMILALVVIFWLTITGANYPSQIIGGFLFWIEDWLLIFLKSARIPEPICEMLVLGIYRVLAWVVSVMLPPMGGVKINQCFTLSICF